MTTMEEIVPENSLFRKIDKYIDFTFIYDKIKSLYCENNGRPSIDPVVLFMIVFMKNGMSILEKIDFQKKGKNFIKKEKNM